MCRRGNTATPQPSCLHFVYSSHSTASSPLVFLPVLRLWLGGVGKGAAHCAPLNRYCSSLILIDAQELSIIALRYDRRAEREKGVVRTDTRDKFRRIASAQWLPSLDCKHDPAWWTQQRATCVLVVSTQCNFTTMTYNMATLAIMLAFRLHYFYLPVSYLNN